ncbi:hypothetical protein SPI_03384 [Niveomyces insectorum RCEF 264]|uniref:N,N-dimethylformamidase beta subunit-like C-terminal domain-containing protein n=1 Tax=Niveomyces insectorum RCEF 264 TaxID=1081102 RepID=A0A167XAS7_9HYPO|nr:hypothetical protein SPI_03384 [Niveomyces insectorum RCEF 264]
MASTVCAVPDGYPAEIIGYADPWIASPGDLVDIKVSSTSAKFTHRTVRLIQGFDEPHAPEVRVEAISQIPSGTCKGRFQQAHPGSYAVVDSLGVRAEDTGVVISLYAQPTLVKAGHDQALVSLVGENGVSGVAIVLGTDQRLKVRVGDGTTLHETTIDYTISQKQWIKLWARIHGARLDLSIEPIAHLSQKTGCFYETGADLPGAVVLPVPGRLTLAATQTTATAKAADYFNGRIEAVRLATTGAAPRDLAEFNFALKMASDEIVDVSGNGRHGALINAPSRAVRGHDWDGSETDWTKASYGYGAIHFHDDDLDDAGWSTDFTIRMPADARSGAYAVEVCCADNPSVKDNITFFVRPNYAAPTTAKVAMILSTFTYTAYANEHLYDEDKSSYLPLDAHLKPRTDEDFQRMKRRDDLGLSLYDVHRDGSGSVFSSTKRPVLNVRPGFQHWGFDRPREFSADLFMIGFLESLGIPYDVTLDHELHDHGVRAIEQYNTVITGSHPEYPSVQSLNAYSEFAARGGNIMYLGGNGFYWMSVLDPVHPYRMEVRRGDQGVRTFGLPGGERHHALNGAQGGLWRARGRAANYLFGIGCCGEGFGPGVPYKRTEAAAASDGKFAWVFEGMGGPEELIGVHGFGGGASGDEIDRYDTLYGSPETAVILATSTGHPDEFALFPEDHGFQDKNILGTQTDRIRSDIVLYETPGGGSVFSVGSMNWYCSLGWDGYKNNVARMTENVLRKFSSS